jgi:tRNA 2-thiouridine synthesizing protein A
MSLSSEQSSKTWDIVADATLDAGDLGCGDLVMAMSKAMASLQEGQVLAVYARDPAAYIDVPAWCNLRGFEFLGGPNGKTCPPFYIRKGGKPNGKQTDGQHHSREG